MKARRSDKHLSLADLHERALAESRERAEEGAERLLEWLDHRRLSAPNAYGDGKAEPRGAPAPLPRASAKAVFEEPSAGWRRALPLAVALGACIVAIALAIGHSVLTESRGPRPDSSHSGATAAFAERAPSSLAGALGVVDPCREAQSARGDSPLVDDFEDGNELVTMLEARNGYWVAITDTDPPAAEPVLLPSLRPEGSPANRYALHVSGGRHLTWGASVQVDFGPTCYDASAYRGIAFDVRGPGRLFAGVRSVDAVPIDRGGTCSAGCYESNLHPVVASAAWTHHVLEWSDLHQRGKMAPVNPRRLSGLEFLVRADDTPYDLWIDDVTFVH